MWEIKKIKIKEKEKKGKGKRKKISSISMIFSYRIKANISEVFYRSFKFCLTLKYFGGYSQMLTFYCSYLNLPVLQIYFARMHHMLQKVI